MNCWNAASKDRVWPTGGQERWSCGAYWKSQMDGLQSSVDSAYGNHCRCCVLWSSSGCRRQLFNCFEHSFFVCRLHHSAFCYIQRGSVSTNICQPKEVKNFIVNILCGLYLLRMTCQSQIAYWITMMVSVPNNLYEFGTQLQIYGSVTMSNILSLSVFLSLVYFRHLTWNFSAEVSVILLVCILMGLIASFRTTFPLWMCLVACMLYPFSLLLLYVLDDVLNGSYPRPRPIMV